MARPTTPERDRAVAQLIADELNKYKSANNLTNEDLARQLGFTVPVIESYLTGDHLPGAPKLLRILRHIPLLFDGVEIGARSSHLLPEQLTLAFDIVAQDGEADKQTITIERKPAKPIHLTFQLRLTA
jgi:transcriptional regulator with XRE-family HTH domain